MRLITTPESGETGSTVIHVSLGVERGQGVNVIDGDRRFGAALRGIGGLRVLSGWVMSDVLSEASGSLHSKWGFAWAFSMCVLCRERHPRGSGLQKAKPEPTVAVRSLVLRRPWAIPTGVILYASASANSLEDAGFRHPPYLRSAGVLQHYR